MIPYDDDTMKFEVFKRLKDQFEINLLVASGFRPDDNIHERQDRLVSPKAQKGKTPMELARLYLAPYAVHGACRRNDPLPCAGRDPVRALPYRRRAPATARPSSCSA